MVDYNDSAQVELRKNQEDPIVMYLIVREELGMSIGKTGAQCAHASQMLQLKFNALDKRLKYLEDLDNNVRRLSENERAEWDATHPSYYIFSQWLESSFRKVVLKADDKEWEKIKGAFVEGVTRVTVVDAGLTELNPNTETVIGIWPMRKSEVPKVIKKLQVLK